MFFYGNKLLDFFGRYILKRTYFQKFTILDEILCQEYDSEIQKFIEEFCLSSNI